MCFAFDYLVDFMPARHIYMRPAQIIIYFTSIRRSAQRSQMIIHTHTHTQNTYQLSGCSKLHSNGFCWTFSSSICHKFHTNACLRCDKIIIYFEQMLSMKKFFIIKILHYLRSFDASLLLSAALIKYKLQDAVWQGRVC